MLEIAWSIYCIDVHPKHRPGADTKGAVCFCKQHDNFLVARLRVWQKHATAICWTPLSPA